MAGGYDGSIRFDTSIDSKGFNTGIKRISGSMKGVMSALLKGFKVVVGIVAIIGAAIIGVVSALISAGIAIFAWAQKFTNTLYKSLSVTSAYRSKVIELKTAFDTLKGSVMGLGTTLLSAIAPVIMTVINWLVKAINYVSMFIAALTGQKTVMQYVSGSTEGAANSAGKLAKNTKEAGKAAKGALAAFDQLNVLQMQEPEEESGGGGGGVSYMEVPIDSKILETVKNIKQWFSDAWTFIKETAAAAWNWILENVWNPVSEWFTVNIITPISEKLTWLWGIIKESASALWEGGLKGVLDQVLNFGKWIVSLLWENIKIGFDMIVNIFKTVFIMIRDTVNGIIRVIGGILEFITGVFTGDWKKAWEGVKDIFLGLWDIIAGQFKGVVNTIIDLVNGMVRGVVAGVNAVIRALNRISVDVPDWVPGFGGDSWGIHLQEISAPQIPHLASGAVIPPNSQFLAVLGDQRHGTNIEAPADLIRQIVREETQNMGSQGVTVNFTGTMAALIQAMQPEITRENKRIGGSLIAGA